MPKHSPLWRKLRAVEKLGDADRKAVIRFIDTLLARQQSSRLSGSKRGGSGKKKRPPLRRETNAMWNVGS